MQQKNNPISLIKHSIPVEIVQSFRKNNSVKISTKPQLNLVVSIPANYSQCQRIT